MQAQDKRVLIIGGGIGGLTTALALQRAGIDASVFERSPELLAVGAGFQLWTNGIRALQRLGVGDEVIAAGSPLQQFQFRTWRGRVLIDAPVGALARKHGVPAVIARRADLLRSLANALDGGVLHTGADCVGYRQDASGVTARFADGREERGDLLVGADGLKSVTRKQLLGEVEPDYAGYQYLRAITEFTHPAFPPSTFWLMWGRAARFGLASVGPGRTYWFGVINAAQGTGDAPGGRKRELLERFKGWAEPVEAVIAATDEAAIGRTDISDIKPLAKWGEGRVTLLGDAAHATTPNLGRGIGEAIEDAMVLARELGGQSDPVAALRAYEAQRQRPTSGTIRTSRRIGAMGRWGNPALVAVRETFMRLVMSRVVNRAIASEFAGELV